MKKNEMLIVLPVAIAAVALAVAIIDCKKIKDLKMQVQGLTSAVEANSNEITIHGTVLSKMQSAFSSAAAETAAAPAPAAEEVKNA